MHFIGEKCVACGKVFNEDDDIVVCPECGSPHHRECYKLTNRCANIDFHAEKKKWRSEASISEEKKTQAVFKMCTSCHFPNSPQNEKCERCGAELENSDPAEKPSGTQTEDQNVPHVEINLENFRAYLGFNPEEDLGGASLKEVSQFVGSNTLYYIPIFKRMKDLGSKVSFHLSCLLFPYFYFANRKMWGWGLFSALLSICFNMPTWILWLGKNVASDENTEATISAILDHQSSLELLDSYFSVASFVVSILFGLFGNWLYYRYTMKSLRHLKELNNHDTIPAEHVISAGGVKPVNILFMALIMLGIGVGVLFGVLQLLNTGTILKML